MLVEVVPRQKIGKLSSLSLVYGFAGLIILGTVLLLLPVSGQHRQATSVINALFTATSAVCVTGLTVVDTTGHWSPFGQAIILALIQIGGFGFMASATIFLLFSGRRISLREKLLIGESMGLSHMGGLLKLVKQMAIFAFVAEAAGSFIFFFSFSGDNSLGAKAWKAVFHSVSAFNNAGFDLFVGSRSLLDYQKDIVVLITTAILIILGGISFLVLADIVKTRRFYRLSLDSKLVLYSTFTLLVIGMTVILLTEFNDPDTLGSLSLHLKLVNSFFQSVTARTAGFSTINMADSANYALFVTMLLMFIGGASGSTAGGIKVNTFGILAATAWGTIRGNEHAGAFGREFTNQQIFRALTLTMLSLALTSIIVFSLTITEGFNFINILFETVSAFGTVGLSTGITADLSVIGKILITITMFTGRLGPLALVLALTQFQKAARYRYPAESIRIG
ncbi:MAG: TrkH family potassium uptake protein [Dehalococcoidia bacterium]|nr:TrkH family potassium uptake protein [Dehalococcoidia bacterium]